MASLEGFANLSLCIYQTSDFIIYTNLNANYQWNWLYRFYFREFVINAIDFRVSLKYDR